MRRAKGGTIKRFREKPEPALGSRGGAVETDRNARAGQWYFQRYIDHLPTKGEIVLFDRSWYKPRRGGKGLWLFAPTKSAKSSFTSLPEFEDMLVSEGIQLFKIWLNVGRAEQLKRFLAREQDVLKQWKLSSIDVEGLKRWDDYTAAISETMERSHSEIAPWTVIRSDDKYRARLNAIRSVLCQIDYKGKNADNIGEIDDKIVDGAEPVDHRRRG